MSKSRPYSCQNVNTLDIQQLIDCRTAEPCVVGVDVGKRWFTAVAHFGDGSFTRPWKIACPAQIKLAVQKLKELNEHCPLTIVMESSGTYGDAFRQSVADAGLKLQRVSGKAVKDQAESFDGVPSQHDGKDAAVIADLGARRKGRDWPMPLRSELEQELRYWVKKLDRHQRLKQVHAGRIESLLARHWPEACEQMEQSSATLVRALEHWGGPASMAADPQASKILRRFGGHYLSQQKIEALLQSARDTVGVRMNRWEIRELKELAKALLSRRKTISRCKRKLRRLTIDHTVIQSQARAVGIVTACVLWMGQGDPRGYGSAAAYRKSMGLNLKERSSGKYQGRLSLTKRGPSLSRKWLYFAALRWMKDPSVKRWAQRKKARDGGKGSRAATGVMRRLALALWHVAVHGEEFNPARLFPSGRFEKPHRAGTHAKAAGQCLPGEAAENVRVLFRPFAAPLPAERFSGAQRAAAD